MMEMTRISQAALSDPVPIRFPNSGFLDAFARQRISNPVTLFDSASEYNLSSLLFASKLTAGGTITHVPLESSVNVATAGGATDAAIRQTFQYFRYQPGKGQLIIMTAVPGPGVANTTKRFGYFDALNGLFFQVTSAGFAIGQRTNVSGSAVDTIVLQAAFNVDRLDGSGPSKMTLDLTKTNIFVIDFQWLGVGQVRFGVYNPAGEPAYCHQIQNANAIASVYMRTANLPIRYEVFNTAGSAGGTLKAICSSVISEGGFEEGRGYPLSATTGITGLATTTRRPILTIRPRTTFNSIVNRAMIIPDHIEIIASAQPVLYELVYGGTNSGGTWANVDTNNSASEFSINSTGIAGGVVIDNGFLATAAGATSRIADRESIASRLPITLDIDGANPKELAIVATSFSGSATVNAGLNWKEIY